MAEKKNYMIKVQRSLVEVTQEVYQAYYQIERHTRTLDEKDRRNGVMFYSNLDTDGLLGEEMIPDQDAASVEDAAIAHILHEKLCHCLAMLPDEERKLLDALFFEGFSERQLASSSGIPYMTVHSRKVRALQKLKNLMER